jgi:bHLH-MYC and R2R3-MYB transcription factors N-terminal
VSEAVKSVRCWPIEYLAFVERSRPLLTSLLLWKFNLQRCIPLNPNGPLEACPQCHKVTSNLVLFPMTFREIDEAHRVAQQQGSAMSTLSAAAAGRGRKRKGSETALDAVNLHLSFTERRTGRWSNEEMAYCDKLIAKFSEGELPLSDSVKLNEFLGNMLKSKQSRLTKKMKNAKLSTKMFQRTTGCLHPLEAAEFSSLEESFFLSIPDVVERAEVKFHMQREWREQFSRVCSLIGQPLDADAWLTSVEEMDRRAAKARDAACMAKRRLMMGAALRTDTSNLQHGVFIEKLDCESRTNGVLDHNGMDEKDFESEMLFMLGEDKSSGHTLDAFEQSSLLHSAPFLAKVTSHLMRHAVPFEHVDLWVPSFVLNEDNPGGDTSCRLCYAGNSTTEKLTTEEGTTTRPLSKDEKFNFFSFGDYSQKFSFNVGCGLPGRVYESGRPTWEQSVQNAPSHHFERCGGAEQWGIKTVVGIPVASPNVGRIVVVLYSCFDRPKDDDLVSRLSEEFNKVCLECCIETVGMGCGI